MVNQQESSSLIPLPELDGYFINIYGDIFSTKRQSVPKKLKTHLHFGKSKNPYIRVKIGAKKLYLVHRLVGSVLLNRPLYSSEFVNHKDDNTSNNHLCNLEVVTHQQNVQHAVENKLYCQGVDWYKARESSTTKQKCCTLQANGNGKREDPYSF